MDENNKITEAAVETKPEKKKRKRRFGDRKDGRKIRSLAPYDYVSPYIMVERNDASNFFRDTLFIEEMEKYIRGKKDEGLKSFGVMHVLIAAYVRLVSQKPRVNRFIGGQKIFARDIIEVNLAIKPEMNENSTDTVIKMRFQPTDDVYDVYRVVENTINEARKPENSGFDNTAKIINYVPGLIKKNLVWLLKLLDYFGLLPKALTDVSPFHGSMFITSMGSLGIPPIYHHLYNFGNIPIFFAFGKKYKENEIADDGSVIAHRYVDFRFTCDERIADGHAYASALKELSQIVKRPEQLDAKPEKVLEDIP